MLLKKKIGIFLRKGKIKFSYEMKATKNNKTTEQQVIYASAHLWSNRNIFFFWSVFAKIALTATEPKYPKHVFIRGVTNTQFFAIFVFINLMYVIIVEIIIWVTRVLIATE